MKTDQTSPLPWSDHWRDKTDDLASKYYRGLCCCMCGKAYGVVGHHIKTRSHGHLRHAVLNLAPLCPDCHRAAHHSPKAFREGFRERFPVWLAKLEDAVKKAKGHPDYEAAYARWVSHKDKGWRPLLISVGVPKKEARRAC